MGGTLYSGVASGTVLASTILSSVGVASLRHSSVCGKICEGAAGATTTASMTSCGTINKLLL